jgi:RNA polymerase-binding transcription factor DksA
MSDVPFAPPSDATSEHVEHLEQLEHVEHLEQVTAEETPADAPAALDLDRVERDLADVELALARLDAGTYWTDEVTGGVIPDEVLAEHPTARRAGSH